MAVAIPLAMGAAAAVLTAIRNRKVIPKSELSAQSFLPHPSLATSPLIGKKLRSPHASSPAIWRRGLSFGTATWTAIRRTAATNSGGDDHVVDHGVMNMGDAMMLGGGRCWHCGAENYSCKHKFFIQHFISPARALRLNQK